jgi:two-component system chemotaxis response regulator CheB
MPNHDIIVIGASAGGGETLKHLMRDLPGDLPAAVMVVVHVGQQSPGYLPLILAKAGKMPVKTAQDQESLRPGHIYVARTDHHLLVERERLRVVRGPKENRHRPAIDPLFRSAAWSHGPRVVGLVLSGTLDDGTAGLWAIKSCGGMAVVQDPADALFPGMPENALRNVEVDHCLPLAQIPALLTELAHQPIKEMPPVLAPERLKTETQFAMLEKEMQDMKGMGKLSAFTCPSCNGSLWELQDGELIRYRCHVGHAFSTESLLAEQSETVETALYAALRALEEKAAILRRLAERYQNQLPSFQADYEGRAAQLDQQANAIRSLLNQVG